MSDRSVKRGRLNGVVANDTSDLDTAEPGCIANVLVDDESNNVSAQKAKVILPNAVPCPSYAVNLHYWNRTTGPTVNPMTDPNKMPPVVVRRDLTDPAFVTVCQRIVAQPVLSAIVTKKFGAAVGTPVAQGEFAELTFFDQLGNTVTGKLGYFPDLTATLVAKLEPKQRVLVTTRTAEITTTFPATHKYAWVIAPIDTVDGRTIPGKIFSGSGASYVVTLFEDGPSAASTRNVAVTQLQIDAAETIPANTWVLVFQIRGLFYMQMPIWLN